MREARLLRYVATLTPLPVPEPVYLRPEAACIGYRPLPGTPLIALLSGFALREWPAFAPAIGALLRALNDASPAPLAGVIAEDIAEPGDYLGEARANLAAVRALIPERFRGPLAAFLAAAPPTEPVTPRLAHNDLGAEHILVDRVNRRITGIIDWGDAALADPASDFGKLYRDLGPDVLDALLDSYGAGGERAALRRRAIFYGQCGVLEDLAYGQETGRDDYVAKSLAALSWLFP